MSLMEKALQQYLKSLSECGVVDLPKGNDEITRQMQTAVEATQKWLSMADVNEQASVSQSQTDETDYKAGYRS